MDFFRESQVRFFLIARPIDLEGAKRMEVTIVRSDQEWVTALQASGQPREQALSILRRILLRGLRSALSEYPAVTDSHREDFVQEALIKILQNVDSYRGESKFLTWAVKIAVRVAFSEMRRHRWKDRSLDEMMQQIPDGGSVTAISGRHEPSFLTARLAEILYKAIKEELSEAQKQVVIAYFLQGIPLDEIARRLGKTRNHLYKIKYEARNRLREVLIAKGIKVSDIEFAFRGD